MRLICFFMSFGIWRVDGVAFLTALHVFWTEREGGGVVVARSFLRASLWRSGHVTWEFLDCMGRRCIEGSILGMGKAFGSWAELACILSITYVQCSCSPSIDTACLPTRLLQTHEPDYWSSSTCRYFFSSRFSFSVMGGRS